MSKDVRGNEEQPKRVQLDMLSGAFSDLNWVKNEIEATSYAEAIRRVVKFIRQILTKKKSGAKVFIQNPDGSMVEIVF